MNVRVDDARIAVEDCGAGEAVVLLHGFPYSKTLWDETFAELAKTRRAIRLDLRGSGESSVPDGPYLMETLAGDVAGVLDALGVECASIVGHSLGGYVALAFARMYSERVARLAIACSRLVEDAPERARAREELALRLERENSMQPAIDTYVATAPAPQTIEKRGEIAQRAAEIARANDPRGAAALLRGMALRAPADDIAQELTMPVCVIAGGADAALSIEEARSVTVAFPDATLGICQASGHLPMLEEPERFNALLGAWLERPAGTRSSNEGSKSADAGVGREGN